MNSSSLLDTPQKIIAAAVRSVGYDPVDSLVLLPVAEEGARAVIRVDLPRGLERASPADRRVASWARQAAGALFRLDGIDGVAFVLFPGRPLGPAGREGLASLPYSAAALALGRALEQGGVRVATALWRALDAWGAYCCDAPGCPLRGPRDVEEISAAFAGPRSASPSFAELASIARASSRARAAVARRLRGLRARPPAIGASLAAWRRATRPAGLAPSTRFHDIAVVLRAFEEAGSGEALRHWSAFGGAALEELSERRSAPARTLGAAPVAGAPEGDGAGEAFDLDRVLHAVVVLRGLAGFADEAALAPALAALAWCEWASGRSSLAYAHAAAALEIEPGHALAGEVLDLACGGAVPAWLAGVARLGPGAGGAGAAAAPGADAGAPAGEGDAPAAA